jgi:hypothetical protein
MLPRVEVAAEEGSRRSPAVPAAGIHRCGGAAGTPALPPCGETGTVRLAAVEARLGQTSMHSSRPPSSDPRGRHGRRRRLEGDDRAVKQAIRGCVADGWTRSRSPRSWSADRRGALAAAAAVRSPLQRRQVTRRMRGGR